MVEGLDRLTKGSDSIERSRRIAAETGTNVNKTLMPR